MMSSVGTSSKVLLEICSGELLDLIPASNPTPLYISRVEQLPVAHRREHVVGWKKQNAKRGRSN